MRTTVNAIRFVVAIVVATISVTLLASGSLAAAQDGRHQTSLADVRAATARYHSLSVAKANDYTLFLDAKKVACIDNPGVGAMGVHYVNLPLVGAGKIEVLKPQALVYEPGDDGRLRLVALEYIAFQKEWDAMHSTRPTLFGQQFMLTPDGNRFGIPAYYSLHVWIWKHNPSGMFSMWNPNVHCDADTDS
jgi:hypothetical protein